VAGGGVERPRNDPEPGAGGDEAVTPPASFSESAALADRAEVTSSGLIAPSPPPPPPQGLLLPLLPVETELLLANAADFELLSEDAAEEATSAGGEVGPEWPPATLPATLPATQGGVAAEEPAAAGPGPAAAAGAEDAAAAAAPAVDPSTVPPLAVTAVPPAPPLGSAALAAGHPLPAKWLLAEKGNRAKGLQR
jgi:hypothetical protein